MILIPAYNEQETIGRVVKEARATAGGAEVVVVNDGSTDETALRAGPAGATVLNLPANLGVGGAVQCGYIYALRRGFKRVVRIDADGQHDAGDIPRLLEALDRSGADLVIGSRFLERTPYRSTLPRRVGIHFFSHVLRLLTGVRVSDPTSGFRALNQRVLGLFARFYPVDFPEVESILIAARAGLRVAGVPVRMSPRRHGLSSIGGFGSLFYMLKVSLALVTEMLRPRPARSVRAVSNPRDGGVARGA